METTQHLTEFLIKNHWPVADEGHHHARPGWLQFDCPHCGRGSHGYHMGFRMAYAYVNCWRCGRKDLAETLQMISRLGSGGDGRAMAATLRKAAPHRAAPSKRAAVNQQAFQPPRGLEDLRAAHRFYLEDRGFQPDELVAKWQIKGLGLHAAHLAWRIYIPVTYAGEAVTYTTRAVSPHVTRYVSARPEEERMSIKNLLYGLDHTDDHAVLVVEGPTDVWRFGWGAVATLGLQVSHSQAEIISRFPRRIICFDNTRDAQRRARRLAFQMAPFPGETLVACVDAEDVGSADEQEIQELQQLLRQ